MITGVSEFQKKMDEIHSQVAKCHMTPSDPESEIKQYKTLVKYLAFVASSSKMPIAQNLIDETSKRVQEFGKAENIRTWSCWTPKQLQVLSCPDTLIKVILIGGNGSGKTMMLKEKAKRRSEEGKKVLFVIFSAGGMKTLLYYQLKIEFKDFNINLICIDYEGLIDKSVLLDSFLFIDEAIDELFLFNFLKKNCLDSCSSIWIASGLDSYSFEGEVDSFELISLDLALRNTKTITNYIKSSTDHNIILHNSLNKNLLILDHMPTGKNIVLVDRNDHEKLPDLLVRAMQHLSSTLKLLICIDFRDICKESFENTITFLKQNHKTVVFQNEYSKLNDKEEDVEKWIANSHEDTIMISDHNTVAGFEADTVIAIGRRALKTFVSRARVYFIHVNYSDDSDESDDSDDSDSE